MGDDRCAASGCPTPCTVDAEELAVLGALDRAEVGADQLDAPSGGELDREVQRRLPAERRQDRVGLLALDHLRHRLGMLETMIDSSVLPCTLTLSWKFTRPGQTVRFEAGEPFCTVLPCPMAGPELEVVSPGDAIACEYDFEQMIDAPAMEEVLRRLRPPAERNRFRRNPCWF